MNETEKMPEVKPCTIGELEAIIMDLREYAKDLPSEGGIINNYHSDLDSIISCFKRQNESFCTQQAEKNESWVEFAYKQGLKLDRFMPFFGIDNKERISKAIELLIKYDSVIQTLEEEKRKAVSLLNRYKDAIDNYPNEEHGIILFREICHFLSTQEKGNTP